MSYRAAVGNFNNRIQGLSKSYIFHSFPFRKLLSQMKHLRQHTSVLLINMLMKFVMILTVIKTCLTITALINTYSVLYESNSYFHPSINEDVHTYFTFTQIDILNIDYYMFSTQLIILSGDIEINPGPIVNDVSSLSITHQNIRSIRNKMEFIKDTLLDFDILYFSETHLTDAVESTTVKLENYNNLYRKDNTAHSGGLLVYVTSSIPSRRIIDLEIILPESIWVEIKDKSNKYLICNVYRPPHYGVEFWDRMNICLERASEIGTRIVLVGDINEDQLNPTNTKFKNVLMLNNMKNIINEPTRVTEHSQTLIDPIAITGDISIYDSGIIQTPPEVSDHRGTYVYFRSNLQSAVPFKTKKYGITKEQILIC